MPWNEVMPKFQAGKLRSSSGQKVTNPMQAVAIQYSEKGEAAKGKQEYKADVTQMKRPLKNG